MPLECVSGLIEAEGKALSVLLEPRSTYVLRGAAFRTLLEKKAP
jgi:hypothetical protein